MDADIRAQIRFAAMSLLAMREHSLFELQEKLVKRFDRAAVEDCLAVLQGQGLQSDERFAEAFIRMRYRQGKGPQCVVQELKQKRIIGDIISEYMLDTAEWNSLAYEVRLKKFGTTPIKDPKSKAKQMRFLASRGFTASNIHYALTIA